ncbi:MAG: tetratricopeptide repeat protein [Pseudomonadales bacterium]|nr:tetratricopeptide repeat protein [Pseudomonadales bacterium]
MRFTNSSALWLVLGLVLFTSGCATTSKDEMKVPSWLDIYDSSEEKPSDKDEDAAPESSADASGRIKSKDQVDQAEEEKPSSLFEFFTGRKDLDEPKKDEAIETVSVETEAEPIEPDSPDAKEADVVEPEAKKVAVEETVDQPAPESTDSEPLEATKTAKAKEVASEPVSITPRPKPLVAKNEQQAIEASKASGDYNRALDAMKAGSLQDALLLFQEIGARYPSLSGPIVNQAIILRQQGKLEQAKALLQKAILNKTQNPYLMNELGLINRELGKFEAAKQAYLSAIRIEPNYDKAHYNLAVLADLYLHDPVLAFNEFEAYQALQPTPNKKVAGWLKEIKRRIK